jgi:hypothetical protein
VRALATDSRIAELTAFAAGNAIIALAQQSVSQAEYKGRARQRSNGARAHGICRSVSCWTL